MREEYNLPENKSRPTIVYGSGGIERQCDIFHPILCTEPLFAFIENHALYFTLCG